jgi:hypothetical protein
MLNTQHGNSEGKMADGFGYENAPATRMMATHCACCGKELLDAASIEAGMGPHCRKKCGYGQIPEDLRVKANELIHAIAANQQQPSIIWPAIDALRGLGLEVIYDKLVRRFAAVRITVDGERVIVVSSYNADAVAAMRRIPGRQWDPEAKVNTFPTAQRAQLWGLIKQFYAGQLFVGPSGIRMV